MSAVTATCHRLATLVHRSEQTVAAAVRALSHEGAANPHAAPATDVAGELAALERDAVARGRVSARRRRPDLPS